MAVDFFTLYFLPERGLQLKLPFPWVALGVGLLIALLLMLTGTLQPGAGLPLLTQLIVTEFGFFRRAKPFLNQGDQIHPHLLSAESKTVERKRPQKDRKKAGPASENLPILPTRRVSGISPFFIFCSVKPHNRGGLPETSLLL